MATNSEWLISQLNNGLKQKETMTMGKAKKAERLALNQFDKWNDVTGFVQPDTGYYYELQAIIKEAVHIGIQMAIDGKVNFDSEGNVEIP